MRTSDLPGGVPGTDELAGITLQNAALAPKGVATALSPSGLPEQQSLDEQLSSFDALIGSLEAEIPRSVGAQSRNRLEMHARLEAFREKIAFLRAKIADSSEDHSAEIAQSMQWFRDELAHFEKGFRRYRPKSSDGKIAEQVVPHYVTRIRDRLAAEFHTRFDSLNGSSAPDGVVPVAVAADTVRDITHEAVVAVAEGGQSSSVEVLPEIHAQREENIRQIRVFGTLLEFAQTSLRDFSGSERGNENFQKTVELLHRLTTAQSFLVQNLDNFYQTNPKDLFKREHLHGLFFLVGGAAVICRHFERMGCAPKSDNTPLNDVYYTVATGLLCFFRHFRAEYSFAIESLKLPEAVCALPDFPQKEPKPQLSSGEPSLSVRAVAADELLFPLRPPRFFKDPLDIYPPSQVRGQPHLEVFNLPQVVQVTGVDLGAPPASADAVDDRLGTDHDHPLDVVTGEAPGSATVVDSFDDTAPTKPGGTVLSPVVVEEVVSPVVPAVPQIQKRTRRGLFGALGGLAASVLVALGIAQGVRTNSPEDNPVLAPVVSNPVHAPAAPLAVPSVLPSPFLVPSAVASVRDSFESPALTTSPTSTSTHIPALWATAEQFLDNPQDSTAITNQFLAVHQNEAEAVLSGLSSGRLESEALFDRLEDALVDTGYGASLKEAGNVDTIIELLLATGPGRDVAVQQIAARFLSPEQQAQWNTEMQTWLLL